MSLLDWNSIENSRHGITDSLKVQYKLNPLQLSIMDIDYEEFRTKGFVTIRGAFADKARDISNEVSAMQSWDERPGAYQMYFEKSIVDGTRLLSRIEKFVQYSELLSSVVYDKQLLKAISVLLEGDARLFKEKVIFKQPGGDGFKHHQDQTAGWSQYSNFFITALISVDEATKENGTLEIIPHTQKSRKLVSEWTSLNQSEVDSMDFETIDLMPGDIVLFDSYVYHGSYPNLSDRQRRVIYTTYASAELGDIRDLYYLDKSKSYPQDCERDPDKEYIFRV